MQMLMVHDQHEQERESVALKYVIFAVLFLQKSFMISLHQYVGERNRRMTAELIFTLLYTLHKTNEVCHTDMHTNAKPSLAF
jgi:hypothetical protein